MKLRWLNVLPFLLSTLFLFGTLFITSCDSEEKITCRPSAVESTYTIEEDINGDGIDEEVSHTAIQEYVYNAENKIEMISIHGDNNLAAKMTLEYNDKGLLAKVVHFDLNSPEEISTWELTYDDHDKPQAVSLWDAGDDLSGPPYQVETFSHDGTGRLITRALSQGADPVLHIDLEFEYNNDHNVTKIFRGSGANRFLYLENLSFDTKSKYYGPAPELETLYVYVFRHQPGRNNPLTARVHNKQESTEVTYNMTYDENGRITSHHTSTLEDALLLLFAYGGNFDFDEVTYSCN